MKINNKEIDYIIYIYNCYKKHINSFELSN